jgi:hypothetical protein
MRELEIVVEALPQHAGAVPELLHEARAGAVPRSSGARGRRHPCARGSAEVAVLNEDIEIFAAGDAWPGSLGRRKGLILVTAGSTLNPAPLEARGVVPHPE